MIEYDYELIRNEGDETRTFKPDSIPTKLDNLSYIEGPNSCGKSTLLHIIALGMHGLKNKEIPKSLRKKMESLLDTNYQKLKFKISISNNESYKLISEKKDFDKSTIDVYEIVEGKKNILSQPIFYRNYNLIYDIPIDPTARLKQLTFDIKDAQLRYGNRVGALKARMNSIVDEIRHSKDPNRINDLKELLNENKKDIEIETKSKDMLIQEKDIIEKYAYHKYYHHYKNECHQLLREIDDIDRSKRKEDKKKKKVSSRYSTIMIQLKVTIKDMKDKYNQVTNYLRDVLSKEDQNRLNIWERIDLNEVLYNFEFPENFIVELIHFKSELSEKIDKKLSEEKLKEGKFYEYMIKLLQNFDNLDIKLPGGKSIKEFMLEIEKLKRDFDPILISTENIEKTVELLDELDQIRQQTQSNILKELKQLKKEFPDSSIEEVDNGFIQEEISSLEQEKNEKEKLCQYYETEWTKKGKPSWEDIEIHSTVWKKFENYTEQQLKTEISKMEENISEIKAKLKSLKKSKERVNYQLELLEKQKEHPYRQYLDKIEDELIPIIDSLKQKIEVDFDTNIKDIIDEKAEHSEDKDRERYYKAIFTYLAKKIDYIRHLNEDYKVTYIDLIDETIITEAGKNIRFADMGTGQSQSAYLKGKLNTADNRKIIALFDEVAMMDSTSLKPIYDKFKDLYTEGSMVVGIVVQRADKVNVMSKNIE
jgi:exonuclease SbcC